MKKRVQKHIDNKEYVKVYICDADDSSLANFAGIIVEQNDKHILMCNTYDFYYDGILVLKKSDISEIKRTDNEKFFQKILEKERIVETVFERKEHLNFHLDSYENMFMTIRNMKIPIVLEAVYGKDERFLIGPVMECDSKKLKINYFNSRGEFDLKYTSCKYKEITHFTIDSPYANMFHKYAKPVK